MQQKTEADNILGCILKKNIISFCQPHLSYIVSWYFLKPYVLKGPENMQLSVFSKFLFRIFLYNKRTYNTIYEQSHYRAQWQLLWFINVSVHEILVLITYLEHY